MTSGLISAIGVGLSSGIRSTTAKRSPTPTWGAASPIPGARYMVANMRGTSPRTRSISPAPTGLARAFRIGSGTSRIGRVSTVAVISGM